jgi:exonuclease SbcC
LSAATATDALVRATLSSVRRSRSTVVDLCERLGAESVRHAVLRDLADTITGQGAGNELRMRLSAFVLAARLEKVAELANERLAAMGDGRYRLRHTDGLAARGARSGLGLEVLDLWTGQTRATSSLSGGESFMASLALALGLADAVREESGGFDLQTLFVDEGFGTLDDESLEQVIDVLDGLREGGRAVGVVSHVAELRTRIASQIVVTKSEHGSTVRTVGTATETTAA